MTERASESDADFFKQRGFGLKIGFGQRPALLVIDMLKAFTNPQMMLGANLDNEIEAIKPLIAVAHERDIPVIFSTVIYNDADLKDAGIWALKQKGVPKAERIVQVREAARTIFVVPGVAKGFNPQPDPPGVP